MKQRILITGGAGFVGSSLGLSIKKANPGTQIIALDNLRRKGSELNLPRLKTAGIDFVHGDVRKRGDLSSLEGIDLILECSAEPSVMASWQGGADYVVETNLLGTIHCLELARENKSDFIFLSTSRVYPYDAIDALPYKENPTRFELEPSSLFGVSSEGLTEDFPLQGTRSLYGATKLASELLIREYSVLYGFRSVINRCGVIAGPWQMGKVDQGIIAFWIAAHHYNRPLRTIGYGGTGKQVRDILHIDDLDRLIQYQIRHMDALNGDTFNVGGGKQCSVSLNELTELCRRFTRREVPVTPVEENRPGDVRVYTTDNGRVSKKTGWIPQHSVESIVKETSQWIREHSGELGNIL